MHVAALFLVRRALRGHSNTQHIAFIQQAIWQHAPQRLFWCDAYRGASKQHITSHMFSTLRRGIRVVQGCFQVCFDQVQACMDACNVCTACVYACMRAGMFLRALLVSMHVHMHACDYAMWWGVVWVDACKCPTDLIPLFCRVISPSHPLSW